MSLTIQTNAFGIALLKWKDQPLNTERYSTPFQKPVEMCPLVRYVANGRMIQIGMWQNPLVAVKHDANSAAWTFTIAPGLTVTRTIRAEDDTLFVGLTVDNQSKFDFTGLQYNPLNLPGRAFNMMALPGGPLAATGYLPNKDPVYIFADDGKASFFKNLGGGTPNLWGLWIWNGDSAMFACKPGESREFNLRYCFSEQAAQPWIERTRENFPMLLDWQDRRPIARMFISNPTHPDAHKAGNDPDCWFNGQFMKATTDPVTVSNFLRPVLTKAIANCKTANAQTLIVWDGTGARGQYMGGAGVDKPDEVKPFYHEVVDTCRANDIVPGFTDRAIRTRYSDGSLAWIEADAVNDVTVIMEHVSYMIAEYGDGKYVIYMDSDYTINGADYEKLNARFPNILFLSELQREMGDQSFFRFAGSYDETRQNIYLLPPHVRMLWPDAVQCTWYYSVSAYDNVLTDLAKQRGIIGFDAGDPVAAAKIKAIYAGAQ